MSTTFNPSADLAFSISNGVVSGPADYMNERYAEYMATVYAGSCSVFNYGVRFKGLTIEQAISVALHTDWNSWASTKAFAQRHGLK